MIIFLNTKTFLTVKLYFDPNHNTKALNLHNNNYAYFILKLITLLHAPTIPIWM